MVRDLKRENAPMRITFEHFEKVIYLRLSMEENKRPDWEASFDYMVNCWIRLDNYIFEIRSWRVDSDFSVIVNRRVELVKGLHNIFLNYCGLLINQDCVDLFPLNHDLYSGYWGYRLATVPNPEAVYPRLFVQSFINRYKNDNLIAYFTNTIKSMMTVMRSRHLYDGFESVYTGLVYLLSFSNFAEMSHELFNWSPKYANAPSIEVTSFLGPFFSRVTTFPDTDSELPNRYFPPGTMVTDAIFDDSRGVGSRNYSDCRQATSLMRDSIFWARDILYKIVFGIIKTGPKGRDDVLDYVAKLIKLNEKREQTHVQRDEVSSDGFMLNWNQICKKLCEPFMDMN
jgi:ubiquitin conjugation factor E4 B